MTCHRSAFGKDRPARAVFKRGGLGRDQEVAAMRDTEVLCQASMGAWKCKKVCTSLASWIFIRWPLCVVRRLLLCRG